ncbi:MAG: hypothetical protein WBE58_20170 [Verrucomicrobiales bacterium]
MIENWTVFIDWLAVKAVPMPSGKPGKLADSALLTLPHPDFHCPPEKIQTRIDGCVEMDELEIFNGWKNPSRIWKKSPLPKPIISEINSRFCSMPPPTIENP